MGKLGCRHLFRLECSKNSPVDTQRTRTIHTTHNRNGRHTGQTDNRSPQQHKQPTQPLTSHSQSQNHRLPTQATHAGPKPPTQSPPSDRGQSTQLDARRSIVPRSMALRSRKIHPLANWHDGRSRLCRDGNGTMMGMQRTLPHDPLGLGSTHDGAEALAQHGVWYPGAVVQYKYESALSRPFI